MEYVQGQSCAEMLRERGRLAAEDVVDICAQACRGLDYAHRNGVIHRDVKPGNILRSTEGIVKIADFGIAKAADDSDITRVGSVIGTAAYLSPEQARGEPAGPPSDLYALGVVAFQLLAGRLPYQGASLTDLARQQESGPPTDLHDLAPEAQPALTAAVMRALTPDPSRRYQTAPEMERALRDGLRGIPPEGGDDTTVALGGTEATRMIGPDRTEATRAMPPQPRARERLQPLPDDPYERRPVAAPVAERRRPRKRRSIVPFVVMALIVVALIVGVVLLSNATSGPHYTRFGGDLQQTFDDLRGAIEDNTR
jgi:eukaryotic-like serine/threonine-protein kinase